MRCHRSERLSDGVAIRTTPSQRTFLEKFAEKHKIPLCEGVRLLIDEAMDRAGAIEC